MKPPVRSDSGQFRVLLFSFAIIPVSLRSSLIDFTRAAMK
jgi:hypothetical protein